MWIFLGRKEPNWLDSYNLERLSLDHSRKKEVKDHYRRLAPEYGTRANSTCEKTYFQLIKRFLGNKERIMELGCGSSDVLRRLGSPFAVACDLSIDMLRMRSKKSLEQCVVTAGEDLPFADGRFDGLFLINLLEHVSSVEGVLSECARVLEEGGIWVAVTPNGDWEFWLNLAERWSLKIPEGPHSFLTPQQLALYVQKCFEILEHRTFLVFPMGPPQIARVFDRMSFSAALNWGFFQYVAARKRPIAI